MQTSNNKSQSKDIIDMIIDGITEIAKRIKNLFSKKQDNSRVEAALVAILKQNAGVFSGLFIPVSRAAMMNADNPYKVLHEWAVRCNYRFGSGEYKDEVDMIFRMYSSDVRPNNETCAKTASFICSAMKAAGIVRPHSGSIMITEGTVNDYFEMTGAQIGIGDSVTVAESAVYQNGCCLEKGYCKAKAGE